MRHQKYVSLKLYFARYLNFMNEVTDLGPFFQVISVKRK